MAHLLAVRSSGRDLTLVRRPIRARTQAKTSHPDLSTFKKADLVEMAEAKGTDASGTKADLVERLGVAE